MLNVMKFKCPECGNTFEFDAVGEHEIISCPICGTECKTVRKGESLVLEGFELEGRDWEE